MSNYLTGAALRSLIGTHILNDQIEWLKIHRWRFAVDKHGRPKVDQDYYDHRMKNSDADVNVDNVECEPNFAALE